MMYSMCQVSISPYDNTPIQYTAIFHGCTNGHFQMKLFNIFFFFFALNIDCEYTLRPATLRREAVLMSTQNLCFRAKKKEIYLYPCKPYFQLYKCGV